MMNRGTPTTLPSPHPHPPPNEVNGQRQGQKLNLPVYVEISIRSPRTPTVYRKVDEDRDPI